MVALRNVFFQYISATSFLCILLAALKLSHLIDWSWWWITAPLWGGKLLFVASMALATIAGLVSGLLSGISSRQH